MHRILTKTFLPVFLGLTISACGSDNDDMPATDSNTSDGTSMPADNDDNAPLILTDFDGTWVGTCDLIDPADDSSLSEILTISIAGDVANSTQQYFTDSTCETANDNPQTREVSWSITYPGATTVTALGEATQLNRTIEGLTFDNEALTPEELAEAPLGVVVYDIALLIDDTLYIGDRDGELDGSTAGLRPTILDEVIVFTRQP